MRPTHTPADQIRNPLKDDPVDISYSSGTGSPMGHTGELRKTKEENKALKVQVNDLQGGLAVAHARIKILEMQAQSQWTLTSESLPPESSKCLIFTDTGILQASYVHSGIFFSHGIRERPSHWMPQPEPPKP